MVTIELRKVIFHGYHGVHPEEHRILNTFELDLFVSYPMPDGGFSHLEDTIDYGTLFEIVQKRMAQPTALLENICDRVIAEIHQKFPQVKNVTISLVKCQTPLANFQGTAGVRMSRNF